MAAKINIAPRRSMMLLALLVIAMVIGSYLFVIALAAACVYVPYWVLTNAEHVPAQALLLFVGGLVIAGAMLWSLVPRLDKFEPPGILLERQAHSRLFGELDEIATSLGESLPREVYLIGQVNAFVADRGGMLGFGSRRILAIGLPLLSALNISEFRAVLAHEFAHYYSGDTKLGPFVYRTQTAMIRTFENIGSIEGIGKIGMVNLLLSLVTFVLKRYFVFFLRVTNFVSRKKEHRADELACLVAGAAPFVQGLRKIHGANIAWPTYWDTEVIPVLNCSCLPAIADGFVRFLKAPEIAPQVQKAIENEIQDGEIDPFDSHPILRERVDAIERLTLAPADENLLLAVSLLDNPNTVEMAFLAFKNPSLVHGALRTVAWDDVGALATVPGWKSAVNEYGAFLQGVVVEAVPDLVPKLPEIGSRIRDPKGVLLSPQQRTQRAGYLVSSAVALALLENGWQLENQPGIFYFHRGEQQLNIFGATNDLLSGKTTREAWATLCNDLGITGMPLAPTAPKSHFINMVE